MSPVAEKLVWFGKDFFTFWEKYLEEIEGVRLEEVKDSLLWTPANVEEHQLTKFRLMVNKKFKQCLNDYQDLHEWSVKNYSSFWSEVWSWTGVIGTLGPGPACDISAPIQSIPSWFPGSSLNYAENLLRYHDDEKTAFFYTDEKHGVKGVRSKTFGQLRESVRRFAASLRKLGVTKGDRVVGYIPNCPEAIEAMAATASIGAIWSSTSPDFGIAGVVDRFSQIKPKVLFSVDGVTYNRKTRDHLAKLCEVVRSLDSLEVVVIIPFVNSPQDINITGVTKSMFLDDFLAIGQEEDGSVSPLIFTQVPFSHPLFIMYSSGTTGAPKCMIHSVGGTLIKHLEEHIIQGNMDDSDTMFYYTTTGWMMWNWAVTALSTGCTIVLYDGSPLHPTAIVLWDLVDACQVTILGTSAKWISVQQDMDIKPRRSHSLHSLKTILSTGSPLTPASYDYVYRDVKTDVLLASISGGTDIISCFMGQNSVLSVHRGEIQSPHLGCGVQAWDEAGGSVTGEPGELVCTVPFPSMPVMFWNDPGGAKYQSAYFNKFEGVWAHEDFMMINPKTQGIIMLGRSDGTLNPSGVRFGSAEIYNIVEQFKEIADSVCVGQKSADGSEERVILFLKVSSGSLTEDLVGRLVTRIRTQLSARHVPAIILPIADIPYTVNGKKVEVAIKRILAGEEVRNKGSLANPESLDLFRDIPDTAVWYGW